MGLCRLHAGARGLPAGQLEPLCRDDDRRPLPPPVPWRIGVRHVGAARHQQPLAGDDAVPPVAEGTPLVPSAVPRPLRGRQWAGPGGQPLRRSLFPLHHAAHHDHRVQRVQQRGQPGQHRLERVAPPLVFCGVGRGCDLRLVATVPRPEAAGRPPVAVALRRGHGVVAGCRHPVGHWRHPRRLHHRRAPHHGEQCQPVHRAPQRGRPGAQHPLLPLPHHRQGRVLRAPLLCRRGRAVGRLFPSPSGHGRTAAEEERGGTHRGEFRARVYRGLEPRPGSGAVQGLYPLRRLADRAQRDLPPQLLQRAQEHRRHAEHPLRHPHVRRALLPHPGRHERRRRPRLTAGQGGLRDGLLPRSAARFNGLSGLCHENGISTLLRSRGLRRRPALRWRCRLRRDVGHLGRTVLAVLCHEDGRDERALHDGPVHGLQPPSLRHSRAVQATLPRRAAPHP